MSNNLSQVISKHYSPTIDVEWKERWRSSGATPIQRKIQCLDLSHGFPEKGHKQAWAFIGFSSESKTERRESAPMALRRALASLPAPSAEDLILYDVGNVICHEEDLHEGQSSLSDIVYTLLKLDIRPIIMGSSYESAPTIYRSIESAFPTKDNAAITFTSHVNLDKQPEYHLENSQASFAQIAIEHIAKERKFDFACLGVQKHCQTNALLSRANELKAKLIFADEFHIGGTEASIEIADATIIRNDNVLISLSMDVFATPFAPGVKVPQPLGLLPWHAIPVLRRLAASGKALCLDITGLCPGYDHEDTTASLAASLIADFLFHNIG